VHLIDLLPRSQQSLRVLALGAHSDDIEIGCGGTLLRLVAERPDLEIRWVVFAASDARTAEARRSAADFLAGCRASQVEVHGFRDGYLPAQWEVVKDRFEQLKDEFLPDVIFTHYRDDRHQDHRVISDLSWNTWRHHLLLEYEIPKYDGDLGTPSVFASLDPAVVDRKITLILRHFRSQADKHWLTADLLRSLPRLRGMECAAPHGLAEAFFGRKLVF